MMQNAPSGIAQLRKSSENNMSQSDAMNLDDFIFSDSAATPINFPSPQAPERPDDKSAHSMAIPIKSRKELSHHFVPQSVPVPAHHHHAQGNEFDYVNRHLRKTSIDDRRVSDPLTSRLSGSVWLAGFSSSPPPTSSIRRLRHANEDDY